MKIQLTLSSICLFVLCACNNTRISDQELDVAAKHAYNNLKAIDQSQKWTYSNEENKMTSDTNYFAKVTSKNVLLFDSPYSGGSTLTLTIRKSNNKLNAYVNVSKGMFTTPSNGGTVRMRFDQEQPKSFKTQIASDGSSDFFFINDEEKLISNIKKHSKLILECEFYQEGTRQSEFDISEFKWSH